MKPIQACWGINMELKKKNKTWVELLIPFSNQWGAFRAGQKLKSEKKQNGHLLIGMSSSIAVIRH